MEQWTATEGRVSESDSDSERRGPDRGAVGMLEPPANQLIALPLARRVPAQLKSLADQVRAVTWRLLHPRG